MRVKFARESALVSTSRPKDFFFCQVGELTAPPESLQLPRVQSIHESEHFLSNGESAGAQGLDGIRAAAVGYARAKHGAEEFDFCGDVC